jgi:hypothetical protein
METAAAASALTRFAGACGSDQQQDEQSTANKRATEVFIIEV